MSSAALPVLGIDGAPSCRGDAAYHGGREVVVEARLNRQRAACPMARVAPVTLAATFTTSVAGAAAYAALAQVS